MNFIKTLFVAMIFGIIVTGCDVLINPEANMIVSQDGNDIKSIIGVYDFGKIETGKSSTVIFKIRNTGKKTLHLNGSPTIEVQGHQYIHFEVVTMPMTSVKRKDWTTFQIKFRPSESQFYATTISIKSNDPDRNPYTFAVKGRGIIVDIDVRQNTNHIDNDTGFFDFGTIYLGNVGQSYVFTIENVGSAMLSLTGSSGLIAIEGTNSTEFEIDESSTSSTLNPGESTTFTITFKPVKVGNKTCKIVIANTDPDENPYNFTIKGSCIDPEIQVLDHEMNNIPNNSGVFDFGANYQDNKILRTFTIKNHGTTDLLLFRAPIITITHITEYAFSIEKQPTSTVSPSYETTFVISFKPEKSMLYSATVTFFNNDEDENPFIFKIVGTGYIPNFDFNGDGIDDLLVSKFGHDSIGENPGMVYLYFGRSNYPADLVCTEADVIFTSSKDIVGFGYSVANAGDVNNDGFDDVLIGSDGANSYLEHDGNAYLFLGRSDPPTEINAKDADVTFNGDGKYDCYDSALSSAGDFNGDGFDDIVLGAFMNDKYGQRSGAVFMYFGRSTWSSKLDSSDADISFYGIRSSDFGRILSYAGDFNNDGLDDIIVGAYYDSRVGKAYIFLGESNSPKKINSPEADVILIGITDEPYRGLFGICVSCAGDFNNDGFSDVIVSDRKWVDPDQTYFDRVYMFFGRSHSQSIMYASDANITFSNDNTDRHFGSCTSYAGDVNNDGIDDIIINEICPNTTTEFVYVFFGTRFVQEWLTNSDADIVISDSSSGKLNYFGFSVGFAGDFNNDQIDDFFMGTRANDEYGKVYIFYGKDSFNPVIPGADADVIIYDTEYDSKFGAAVAGGK